MGSSFRKKLYILVVITLILFIVIGITATGQGSIKSVSNIVSVPLKPVIVLFNNISDGISGFFDRFGDIKALKEENEELHSQIRKMKNENEQIVLFRKENSELKDAFSLFDIFNDGIVVGANIIARNTDNWFDIFTVDAGTGKDIKENVPVVDSANALVGRVMEADIFSSKIITITDPESRISGMLINEGADIVKIKGDYRLGEQGFCRITDITDDIEIAAGDIVQTSGMGGIYPKGIAIGIIEEVYKTSGEIHREALLRVFTDYKELDKVFLIIEGDDEE